MTPNQRLIADDGYEIMLFPLEYMNISQGENTAPSGNHYLAMDFLGWDANGRVYQCPYYAPCSCRCVAHWGSDANATWQSLDKVHLADGSLSVITFCFQHDNNPPAVGTEVTQGDLIGHTGTAGYVTGDHVHLNTAIGAYAGYDPIGSGWYELKNSSHIYNTCYVNDTTIVNGYSYPWKTYDGPVGPTEDDKKRKFPWFIYANRLRDWR